MPILQINQAPRIQEWMSSKNLVLRPSRIRQKRDSQDFIWMCWDEKRKGNMANDLKEIENCKTILLDNVLQQYI